eukprot:10397255-Alexandrium_andersonii.AAC.1
MWRELRRQIRGRRVKKVLGPLRKGYRPAGHPPTGASGASGLAGGLPPRARSGTCARVLQLNP